jgi:DNA-binding NarL/FixJ family response regulator
MEVSVITDNRTQVSQMPINTLIADDDYLFRITVRRLLEQAPEVSVVGEANDGEEAIQLAQELQPDLVLMDISMPRLDGLEATRRIKAERPNTKVIILTVHQEEAYRKAAGECRADAFLTKKTVGSQLLPAIMGV